MNYKAIDNSLHCIEPAFAHLLPAGCVPITEAEAEALRPKPSVSDMKSASIAKVKELRRIVFASLAGLQAEAIASGDTVKAAGIIPVQAALRNLPTTNLSACQNQADIDAAFLNAWSAIVAITPANVVSAFNDIL